MSVKTSLRDKLEAHPIWSRLLQKLTHANKINGYDTPITFNEKFVETRCPGHNDKHPSLWIGINEEGGLWLKDKSGRCDLLHILDRLGLDKKELGPSTKGKVVDEYIYRDTTGVELYRKRRYEPKAFCFFHKDSLTNDLVRGRGGDRILYQLECIAEAREEGKPLWICEGEKDAKTAYEKYGQLSTTNDDGADGWKDRDTECLHGIREIVLVCDRDPAGSKRARLLWRSINGVYGTTCLIRMMRIPEGFKDLTDLAQGGWTLEQVTDLIPPEGITEKDIEDWEQACNGSLMDLVERFVYVTEVNRFVELRTFARLNKEQFDAANAKLFPLGSRNKPASVNFLNSQKARIIEKLTYAPGAEQFLEEDGQTALNIWESTDLVPTKGDVNWWLNHLRYMLPKERERETLLNWCAWIVQNPGLKPNWAVLLGGDQGIGKDLWFDPVIRAVGHKNVHYVTPEELSGGYTGYLMNSRLIVVEEMMNFGRVELKNKLKPMIAAPPYKLRVSEKYLPAFEIPNRVVFMFFTNERDALIVEKSDRRFYVLWSEADPQSGEYYEKLADRIDKESGAVYQWLLERDVSGFNPRMRPEMTEAKREMIEASRPPMDCWLEAAKEMGEFPFHWKLYTIQDVIDGMPDYVKTQTKPNLTKVGLSMKRCGLEKVKIKGDVFLPEDLKRVDKGELTVTGLRNQGRFVRTTLWGRKATVKKLMEEVEAVADDRMRFVGEAYFKQFERDSFRVEKLKEVLQARMQEVGGEVGEVGSEIGE